MRLMLRLFGTRIVILDLRGQNFAFATRREK